MKFSAANSKLIHYDCGNINVISSIDVKTFLHFFMLDTFFYVFNVFNVFYFVNVFYFFKNVGKIDV